MRKFVGFVLLVVALGWGSGAGATPLLSDDFNDNSLNNSLWRTALNIPGGGASVTETNGRIRFVNRGHLITQQELPPGDIPGGITITGEWTFESEDDIMLVLTRSDAVPVLPYGGSANAINFTAWMHPTHGGVIDIYNQVTGQYVATSSSSLSLDSGDTFEFRVTDDGTNLSFTMTEIQGAHVGSTATAAGVDTTVTGWSYVEFHNRESTLPWGGSHTAYLDNVVITPEPSTALLFGSGLVGLGAKTKRRGASHSGDGRASSC